MIGDLNTHPNPIVAQYSFWATVEHPSLGLANVRVAPEDFATLPPNVQGWALRTLTKGGSVAADHYDTIVEASQSAHFEVREANHMVQYSSADAFNPLLESFLQAAEVLRADA